MKSSRIVLVLVAVFTLPLAQQIASRAQGNMGNQGIPDRVAALEAALAARTGTVVAFAATPRSHGACCAH